MQSTAVHILPVLDLGPPSGSNLRDPDDAAAFDSLLYRPAPPPPACPTGPPDAKSYEDQPAPNDAAANPPADQEPAATADHAAAPVEEAADSAPIAEADDNRTDDDQPDDAEVAAALALAAAAAQTPPPVAPTVAAEHETAIQTDPIESTPQLTASPAVAAAGLVVPAPTEASVVAQAAATPLESQASVLDQSQVLESGVNPEQLAQVHAETKLEEGDAASQVTHEAASEKPTLAELQPSQFEQSTDDSRDPSGETAADAKSLDILPEFNRQPAPAAERPVAATAASEAKPASSETSRATPPNAAIDAANGSVPRSRLPAAVLVREPAPARGALHIDSARLLNRVARAFTAAQQQGGEIQLRLSPPELGSLRLVVQIEDRALVAHLEAETPAARTALIDNLPVLRERLAEQGVRIHRFDVDLMQRHAGDQPGGLPQRSPEQERYFSPPRAVSGPQPALPSAVVRSRLQHVTPGGLNVIV